MRVLSICTGMGLLDKAFTTLGYTVIPGCEIDEQMRGMHQHLCPGQYLTHDLKDLIHVIKGQHFDGVIGGPSCQAHTRLKAIANPKFPDLTEEVIKLLDSITYGWFLFENVVKMDIPDSKHSCLNAMNFHKPHQSRRRWFTHSQHLKPPKHIYSGGVDYLMAYPAVAGRTYGPIRGAILQGYPKAASFPFPSAVLQHGLANAVHYPLGIAWARTIKKQTQHQAEELSTHSYP